jgi:A/G-specific adenine glycosylase
MQQYYDLSAIVEPLLAWYEQNRRLLPWRQAPSPYHVWLSEIMLQQTRIEAVIPYYERFLAACPTIKALSEIDDEALMKLWEGLGYYSRARNLKKAAIAVMQMYGGELPPSYEALLSLPGIGAYTAGAISSIAFGLPEPAVDGNVLRVIARLTADESDVLAERTKRRVTEALRAIYPRTADEAADMTQALMELGEQLCIPNGTPRCESCPLGAFCRARAERTTDRIPYRAPKKGRKIRKRTVLLLLHGGKVALRKRGEQGLLAGLWEFVSIEAPMEVEQLRADLATQGMDGYRLTPTSDAKHVFTHVEWLMRGYFVQCEDEINTFDGTPLVWVTLRELTERYALPTAYRAFVVALVENSLTTLDKAGDA